MVSILMNMRNRINIVVPMLGQAKRFQAAGIWTAKPLVKARGKTLIEWSMKSLGIRGNYIFLIREMDEHRFGLEQYLRETFGSCVVIKTDKPTEGTTCSSLLASRFIDNNTPLIITNCDQYYEWNPNSFFRKLFNYNADGGILTFNNDHPKRSYARLNDEGLIAEVAENKVISDHAAVGTYYWLKGKFFVDAAYKMMRDETKRVNNEWDVPLTFNECIEDGARIINFDVNSAKVFKNREDLV